MLVKELIALLKKQPKDAEVEVLREVEHAYSVNTEYTAEFAVNHYLSDSGPDIVRLG